MSRRQTQRARTEQIKFWATPEEKELIQKKMELSGIVHMGAYLRKMSIDGYVVKLDLPELKELLRLIRITSNNINQIAKGLNATGRIYQENIQEVKIQMDTIYEEVRNLIFKLSTIQ